MVPEEEAAGGGLSRLSGKEQAAAPAAAELNTNRHFQCILIKSFLISDKFIDNPYRITEFPSAFAATESVFRGEPVFRKNVLNH